MKKGKLITLEGCEGAGKSTQIRLLERYLTERNVSFIITREPGGSQICEKIRDIILSPENLGMSDVCEAFLYASARAQHIKEVIEPALNENKLVICDRYIDSTFAYQGVARGLGASFIKKLNELSVGKFTPDLTLFLDINPVKAFERKGGADSSDRLELMDIDFHNKVYEGYKMIAKEDKNRFVCVNSSGSKFETHENILKILRQKKVF